MDVSTTPSTGEEVTPGEATVAELFARLSSGDTDGAVALFSEDVEMEVPFQPTDKGFWARTSGRNALARFLGSLPALFDGFLIEPTHTYACADPGRLIVRYRSDALVRATGRRYANVYIGVFGFASDGRIREWTEFHNPRVLLHAFDREEPRGDDG